MTDNAEFKDFPLIPGGNPRVIRGLNYCEHARNYKVGPGCRQLIFGEKTTGCGVKVPENYKTAICVYEIPYSMRPKDTGFYLFPHGMWIIAGALFVAFIAEIMP